MDHDDWVPPVVLLTVDLVILTLRQGELQVLLVERGVPPNEGMMALPGGFLHHVAEPIDAAARRELAEESGLDADGFVLEQFGVYGAPGRDPRGRVVTVAYLAIAPRLPDPVAGADAADARWTRAEDVLSGSVPLAFDHRRIVADGVEQARVKLEHSAIAAAFCGPTFTISELQQVYEAVWGVQLDPRNFYRKIQGARDFVVPVGPGKRPSAGRPARLFRAGPGNTLYPPMARPRQEPAMSKQPTIVILTAIDPEYRAVRAKLTNLKRHAHPMGTLFEVGRLAGHDSQVALAQVGAGNHTAAVLAERAIAEFAPVALLFVGVAGRLRESLALGDIVVANRVYAYHGGTSLDDGLKSRPRAWEASHRALQIAQYVSRTGDWIHHLPDGTEPPAMVFGAIAAGEIVQDSTISAEARWIREHYNDACAIEMEAAGVAQAAHLNDSLPVVVIRGISDPADGTKATADSAGWQSRAAANAAAFAAALAAELVEHLDDGRAAAARPSDTEHSHGTSTIVAKDNSRVGVQVKNNYGDIWLGPDHGTGQVSFNHANRRITERGTFQWVLTWLRGALVGVTDLATGVTAVLAAIRSAT